MQALFHWIANDRRKFNMITELKDGDKMITVEEELKIISTIVTGAYLVLKQRLDWKVIGLIFINLKI